jgi:hypothetical protein
MHSIPDSLGGVLVVALLPGMAVAEIIDGRPGQRELSSITIDATSGDCRATYEAPAQGNLWVRDEDATVHVVVNRNGVGATCCFTDISRLIEANADVGYTDACTLVTDAGTWSDGIGRVTSAVNISDRSDGGNSIMCRFDAASAPAGLTTATTHEPVRHVGSGDRDTPRESGEPVWTGGPNAVAEVRSADRVRSKGQAATIERASKATRDSKTTRNAKAKRRANTANTANGRNGAASS